MPDALLHPMDLSLWEATAEPAPPCPPFAGPAETEVAVVGAGFLGCATALALAEQGVAVTLLEAAEGPGGGASGRSGGQVIPGLRHDPRLLVERYGPEVAARLDGVAAGGGKAVWTLVARHGIACDASPTGYIQAVDTEAGLADGRARAEDWRARGEESRFLPRAEMAAALGSDAYPGGWTLPSGGHVQPLSYARGLGRAALAAGARVHGRSPVTAMRRDGATWVLDTQGGTLRARRVLLATNGRDGGIWPGLSRATLLVRSFQVATPPLSEGRRARILPGRQSVSDTRRVLRYFRRDAAGRVVVGGKGTFAAPERLAQFGTVRRMLARLYPDLAAEPLDFAWGGEIAIALDRWPRLMRLGPDAWAAMLDNGKGVALTTAMAPHLAAMLATGEEGASPLPVGEVAPIPVHGARRLYVGLGSLWLRARDALERRAA